MWGLRLGEGCRVSHLLSTPRRARPRYLRCMYDDHGVLHHPAVSLGWFTDDWAPADSHAWPRIFEQEVDSRQPTDGRGCREKWRGDRLEMYDHGRLPTLTAADSRCVAFALSACDRVKPYPSVTGPLRRFVPLRPLFADVVPLKITDCGKIIQISKFLEFVCFHHCSYLDY